MGDSGNPKGEKPYICHHGHVGTAQNTWYTPAGARMRVCRDCEKLAEKRYRALCAAKRAGIKIVPARKLLPPEQPDLPL